MSTFLPSDEEVEHQLADVRLRVMEATRTVRSPRQATGFRRARNLVITGVAGLALTAGSIVIALNTEAEQLEVRCFEGVSLSARSTEVFYVDAVGSSPDLNLDAQLDPIAACSTTWATGGFTPGTDPNTPIYTVPPLAACELNNGIAAVFPNRGKLTAEKLCGTLGLAVWDPDSGV